MIKICILSRDIFYKYYYMGVYNNMQQTLPYVYLKQNKKYLIRVVVKAMQSRASYVIL